VIVEARFAGAGFRVERLAKFLAGAKHVGNVQLFKRIPSEKKIPGEKKNSRRENNLLKT